MTNNKLYDALLLPTGETTSGDRESFPVTNKAVELFKSGEYGCIFVTGGYGGFVTAERKAGISEAQETVEYLLGRGIPLEKIFYDSRSLDSVGNFTFPVVKPMYGNPNLKEFDNMQIIAKKGHMWRLLDYAKIVMPDKFKERKIGSYYVSGEHNNGPMARVYHKGLMNALKGKEGAEEIHDFLIKHHPFYSEGWYDKSPLERKIEMGAIGLSWLLR